MKKIFFLILLACSSLSQAQTANAMASKTTSKTVSSTSSKTTSASISVQDSDDSYSLSAKFDSSQKAKIQKLLLESLDKEYLARTGEKIEWKKSSNDETAYSVVLSSDKLRINVDKELVSASAAKKFKSLGEKISEALRNE
ncbi:MAG TPA: hypothetical protein VFR70_09795 [Flavobacterium sp.]|nr:hypothetical protein [Flavobacterium sp.]